MVALILTDFPDYVVRFFLELTRRVACCSIPCHSAFPLQETVLLIVIEITFGVDSLEIFRKNFADVSGEGGPRSVGFVS